VEDAKANCKNAQPCYDAALNVLIYLDYIASTNARQCQEYAKNYINDNLGSIDRLITVDSRNRNRISAILFINYQTIVSICFIDWTRANRRIGQHLSVLLRTKFKTCQHFEVA